MAKDRRGKLVDAGATLNGIDFVEIAAVDQKTLRVHFLNPVAVAGTITAISITGGETIATVPVNPVNDATDWTTDIDGNPVLTLSVDAPGDFSTYTLAIDSPKLDEYFSRALFSFKALCDSPLDCKTPAPECPGPDTEVPPIDYLAKDFLSFRKALSDFSALRYPDWQERSEADFGVMMMEALCAIADDLSYQQDRIVAEATLDTAGERRSIVRASRLVDYEPSPAIASQVLLQFTMSGAGPLPAGLLLTVSAPDGTAICFETGTGLNDTSTYLADKKWNKLIPYYFDDSERCLKAGATEMWVEGHGWGFQPGQSLLIETAGLTTADPPLRQMVRLLDNNGAIEETDQVFAQQITRLVWRPDDALTADRDLTQTVVKGNLVPATQGRRFTESFAIGNAPPATPQMPVAVARTGPNGSTVYRHTLDRTGRPVLDSVPGSFGLAWLLPSEGTQPQPEIQVMELKAPEPDQPWTWKRWLLDAGAFDHCFTIDPARYSRLGATPALARFQDYDGDQADTVRFGDGVFGDVPEDGAAFSITYRVGGGTAGNVAPDSVWRIESASAAEAATNPFAASGGADAETDLAVRRRAPDAFRAVQYRAVRREDYETAAEILAFVQRAGTAFRWTGSWITVFTTVDPIGSTKLSIDQRLSVIDLLNRYRMAGYESYVPNPKYAAIDLRISVCARSDAFRGDVQAAVLDALSTRRFVDGTTGFFHPDNFTFGQALERSRLEATIQRASGVGGVIAVEYRRRGFTAGYVNMPPRVVVGVDEIILLENDPSRPERGSLRISVEGGK